MMRLENGLERKKIRTLIHSEGCRVLIRKAEHLTKAQ